MAVTTLTQTEAQTHQAFTALMWGLSYPGRVQKLPQNDSFAHIAQALLDLETSFYTPDEPLAAELGLTRARPQAANAARYQFYPTLTENTLDEIAKAPVGTMLYPDQSATLIIGCTFGQGQTFTLTGPGIKASAQIQVDGLPTAFWSLRQSRLSYPLGWDVFLVDESRLIGLPRTTSVAPIS